MVANFIKAVDLLMNKYSVKLLIKYIIPNVFIKKYYQYLSSIDLEKEALLISPVSTFFSQKGINYSFIDIGANHGAWSFEAAKYFKLVYAFECHPLLLKLLRQRVKRKKNISLHEFAISDIKSTQNLFVPLFKGNELTSRGSLNDDANAGFDQVSFQVFSRTLDSFSFNQIALVKIDVEGHEMSVLKGSAETIKKNSPLFIIEIEDRHHPGRSHEIFDYLIEMGYLCYCIVINECIHLDRDDFLSKIEQRKENNFIFIPNENKDIVMVINNYLHNKL